MANNGYTDNMSDGQILTDAQLDTALTTLKLDISNTDQMTQSAASNTFLKATTAGAAASWATTPDPKSLGARDYGLKAFASANQLVVQLVGPTGGAPSSSVPATITISSTSASTAIPNRYDITGSRELKLNAGASLGRAVTTTLPVFVYAIQTSTAASGVKLAVSSLPSLAGGQLIDAIAAGSGSDANGALYATAAFTAKHIVYLGRIEVQRASGGNWSSPSLVSIGAVPDLASNYAISQSCGSFTTSASGTTAVTNLSMDFYVKGRGPVELCLVGDDAGSVVSFATTAGGPALVFRSSSTTFASITPAAVNMGPGSFRVVHIPGPGAQSYDVAVTRGSSGGVDVTDVRLLVREL